MRKKHLAITVFLTGISLPLCSTVVTQAPLFTKELFRQIFPGSDLELSRARFIPVGLAPRASSHGMHTAMKHRAMEHGQRAAYAHVEQQFKNADDFFSRFFTTKDIQHLNKIFLQSYNDDGIQPQQHGTFRSQPLFVPREQLMLLQRLGHGVQAIIPKPPFELENKTKTDAERFLAYVEQNATHAWTLLNGVAMPNWKYISAASEAQLALDQAWTRKHIHVFPPHEAKDLINAKLATEKAFAPKAPVPSALNTAQTQKDLERMLGQHLSDLKSKIAAARRDEKKIVEIAAAAHMGIIRLHPFLGANKRTALIVMNAILRYSGLPAAWFGDGNAYHVAVFEDLKTPNKSENFHALLQKALAQRAANKAILSQSKP